MLENPDLDDAQIIASLQEQYGLTIGRIEFLPIGADQGTAVYRAVAAGDASYFVKLRGGPFDDLAVVVPRLLSDRGAEHIIAPLPAVTGRPWARLEGYTLVLYPFVAGQDGYQVDMADAHWRALGATIKAIHTSSLPPAIGTRVRRESHSPWAREMVRSLLERVQVEAFSDPSAEAAAEFLQARRDQILDLLERTDRLAVEMRTRPDEFVLCHADMHAGNFHIGEDGEFYLVDWDEVIVAPKERDLMFVGGGLGGRWRAPEEEERLFYEGYGPVQPDLLALTYYRYNRILVDIAEIGKMLLLSDEGGADREQSLRYLEQNFEPGGVLEIAYASDRTGLV